VVSGVGVKVVTLAVLLETEAFPAASLALTVNAKVVEAVKPETA
jgi:sulfur carrier protein ThiS